MNTSLTTTVILVCLFGAVLSGKRIRAMLPEHHLSADTRDTVKLAMGLIATLSALLLGLLVNSAKGSYDTARSEVLQMAGKIAFLDRVLHLYGSEAAPLRAQFRTAVEEGTRSMWSREARSASPAGDTLYLDIQALTTQTEVQRSLKAQAASLAVELGQLRALLRAQSLASISRPLLVVVVVWLLIIFFSFSLLAPPNATATLALLASACCVAGALFLILEMDQPFTGFIRISQEPLLTALQQTMP